MRSRLFLLSVEAPDHLPDMEVAHRVLATLKALECEFFDCGILTTKPGEGRLAVNIQPDEQVHS